MFDRFRSTQLRSDAVARESRGDFLACGPPNLIRSRALHASLPQICVLVASAPADLVAVALFLLILSSSEAVWIYVPTADAFAFVSFSAQERRWGSRSRNCSAASLPRRR